MMKNENEYKLNSTFEVWENFVGYVCMCALLIGEVEKFLA
jgi:hypothetical protein